MACCLLNNVHLRSLVHFCPGVSDLPVLGKVTGLIHEPNDEPFSN